MYIVELKINMVFAKNPDLIKSLGRSVNPLLNRRNSNIPFNVQ